MSQLILDNLNELKGGLENFSDTDLLENRIKLVELVNECLENVKEGIKDYV